jgi:hypothetical protein
MTLKLKEGVIMKNRLALASVICLLLVLTLSVSAYTPWGIEVVNDGLPTVVGELRMAYELASATQAASPDFLSDLESLITRLEALVFAPNTSTFGFETLMSTPVEVSYFNRFVGSDDQIGQILYFRVVGDTNGLIWGSGIYTRDTNIHVAAVHAGLVQPGEAAIVAARVLPGQESYPSTTRYGVTSKAYGTYDGSYEFVPIPENTLLIKDPGHLDDYRGFTGRTLAFQVIGSKEGGLWGTDVYTLDSNLAKAAVHTGLLHAGETGIVLVEFLPGQASYEGTDKFGVSSKGFGSYDYSYRLRRLQ